MGKLSQEEIREIARDILRIRKEKEDKLKKVLSKLIIDLDMNPRDLGNWHLSRTTIRCSIKDGNVLFIPTVSNLYLDLGRVKRFIEFFNNAKTLLEKHGEDS